METENKLVPISLVHVSISIHSSDLTGAALTSDATKLHYLVVFESGYDLWVHDFVVEETKRVVKLGTRHIRAQPLS